MICITCPILHEIVCIDLICNGYVLVLIEVELMFTKKVLDIFEKQVQPKPISRRNQKLTQQHNWN